MQSQIAEGYDLSPQQRRLWLRLRREAHAQTRARALLTISGQLDLSALRRACAMVAGRHEALRTSFYRRAGMRLPLQVVAEEAHAGWDEQRVKREESGGTNGDGTGGNGARMSEAAEVPALEVRVVRVGETEHKVELSVAALCADWASLGNVARELARCYEAVTAGTTLHDEAVSYIQFSEWQNQLLESEDRNALAGRAFWRRQDVRSFPALTLPFEARQSISDKFATESVAVRIGTELMARVEEQAQRHGSTVECYLLGCWAALLWRLTGAEEMQVAERVSGRKYAELGGAVGLFEKWLPVGARVVGGARLADLLAQIEETRREGRAWEEYFSWEDEAAGDDDAGCVVGFDYEQQAEPCCAAGVKFTIVELSACHEQFKLRLSCRRDDEGARLVLHFDAGLYAADDMRRMASSLLRLIESTTRTPEALLSRLDILDEQARMQLVEEFNQTRQTFAEGRLLHELFEEQAGRTPDAVAVVCEDDSLSYAQLNMRANQLAHRLQSLGVGPEVVVAIMLERSVEICVALLGVMKAGGAYLPVDPKFPQRRVTFMLEDTHAPVLLTQKRLLEEVAEYGGHVVCLDTDWTGIARESAEPPRGLATGANLVYVIYTSGSTGVPKGVAVEHRQLFNYVNGVRESLDLPHGGSYAMVSTFAADLGNTVLYPALCGGGRLHIISQDMAASPAGAADYFSLHPVDCLKIVPSHFAALLTAPTPEHIVPRRRLILGGEAAPRELAERAKALRPDCEVVNHYGPTETTVGVLTYRIDAEAADGSSEVLPLGRPIANAQVYVLDSQMQPVPINVPGELYVGGAGVTRGYLHRPELTAERFLPDHFSRQPGARLYRTGDRARRLPTGAVEFLGRVDDQVKFHGHRVELGELRAALNHHPQVRDSVVVVRRDTQGRPLLAAYYVARREMGAGELREFLLGEVAAEVVPQVYVHLRRLPLTLNGKVNYAALPEVERGQVQEGRSYAAPRTPVEEVVCGVWAEVLGIERVGIEENFFELGGHSLMATQVVSRVREALGVELPLRTLFETPTVAGLSRWITSALKSGEASPTPPILPVARDNSPLLLSYAQQRLWFLHQLEPESAAYNIFGTVRFGGSLDVDALARSLREVARRHEVLRTTFAALDGVPRQVIGQMPVVKLEAEAVADEAEVRRLAAEEAGRPFDLERGPVFRVRLLRLSEDDHVLFYTMHHIVSDAWSMDVLFKEVAVLYQAFMRGEASTLAELPVQYADYAAWQREWLQGEVLDEQLSYWRRQLAGAPPLTDLPADRPRPPAQSFRGAVESFLLSKELTQALRKLSRQENVTPFMTLLAGFGALLARRTGRHDLVLGTDVANRTRPESEPLIGFFVNQLALRLDLAGDPSFVELVRRARAVCLGAYAHQEVPFERVVGEAAGAREAGQTPLFQVLFVVQNAPSGAVRLPDLSIAPLSYDSPTSKFDLGVFITESARGLECVWRYSTDLFEAETIRGLGRQYETLLGHAAARPGDRLSALDIFTEEEKEQQKIEKQKREGEKLQRLMSKRRAAVALTGMSLVKTELLDEGEKLPLVLRAAGAGLDLAEWVGAERPHLARLLHHHGALLFRGFPLDTPARFEAVASALCPDLYDGYGDLPRAGEGGKVYGSTPYPAERAILFHNESSHLDRWPLRIMFCCLRPAERGGETPIVDCRKVYALLDPRLRERFERKRLMYVRNFTEGLDVSWREFFRTESRAVVEELCRKASVECEWKDGGGLRTRQLRRAVARHPRTGELLFFNQIQLHHVSCLDPEVRESVRTTFGEEDLPRNVYYGDGSTIEDSVVEEVCETSRRAARAFPWQEGDVLMLDNMLTAHARNPYVGERKIVVAMGEMVEERELET
jgi:amino acid adenylation domain-containing protein